MLGRVEAVRPGKPFAVVEPETSQRDGDKPFFSLSEMEPTNAEVALSIERLTFEKTASSNGLLISGLNSNPTLAKEVPQ
jgi:hypothetical protein